MSVEINENEIDQVHYIGKPVIDKNSKKCKSIIVKFKSWKSRRVFYKPCPKSYIGRNKKPGAKFSYDLLKLARVLIKNNASVLFIFCDENCSLVIKFNNNAYKYFNIENELKRLLDV